MEPAVISDIDKDLFFSTNRKQRRQTAAFKRRKPFKGVKQARLLRAKAKKQMLKDRTPK